MITIQEDFRVEFYDVDSMQIVWHGNYIKYFEKARCTLLDKIGYNYLAMARSGYLFPVVDIKARYTHSLRFNERARIVATLEEWENCIKISYRIYKLDSEGGIGQLCTKGESLQMCVKADTEETQYILPQEWLSKVAVLLKGGSDDL